MQTSVLKRIALILSVLFFSIFFLSACNKDGTGEDFYSYPAYQTMEGFGASSAWTSQLLGSIDDEETVNNAVNMLYGDDGLRLNIYRYNIGGGSKEAKFDELLPYSQSWYSPERRAESFFDSSKYSDKESFSDKSNYDFSKDKGAMKVFEKSLDTGNIQRVVFFANSPHYLMTESGKATGDTENQNNLKPEFYEAYCDYLFIIVKELYDTKLSMLDVIPEVYISPVNEPQWKWGGEGSSQEGCHFDADVLAAFCKVFYEKLNAFNSTHGTGFIGDIFESGNYLDKDIKAHYEKLAEEEFFSQVKHISVHSYSAGVAAIYKTAFSQFINERNPGMKISVTEYCEMKSGRDTSIESGLHLGKVISRDLTILNTTDWSWWLALSIYDFNDGLVYWDTEDNSLSVLKRYYVMAHFSRYIDKGDKRIEYRLGGLSPAQANDFSAYQKPDGTVIVVIVNDGDAKEISLEGNFKTMKKITTNESDNLLQTSSDFNSSLTVGAKSVTTLILQN